jgi:hypothetical protein
MTNNKIPKKQTLYCCEKCIYDTYNKKDFTKHLATKKHLKMISNNNVEIITNSIYHCICNKKYKHMSSLCKHKKHCNKINDENEDNIFSLLKEQKRENQELKELLNKQNKIIESLIKNNISVLLLPVQSEFPAEKSIL